MTPEIVEHAVISQRAEAIFGRVEIKFDRIDEQTSWLCYKSYVMFDNISKEQPVFGFLALGIGLRIILIGIINLITVLGGKHCE